MEMRGVCGTPAYSLGFSINSNTGSSKGNGSSSSSSSTGSGQGGINPISFGSTPPGTSSNGYLSISSAADDTVSVFLLFYFYRVKFMLSCLGWLDF